MQRLNIVLVGLKARQPFNENNRLIARVDVLFQNDYLVALGGIFSWYRPRASVRIASHIAYECRAFLWGG